LHRLTRCHSAGFRALLRIVASTAPE